MKYKSYFLIILSALVLVGCGNSASYELKPTGTNETEAPIIYGPDGAINGLGANNVVSTEEIEESEVADSSDSETEEESEENFDEAYQDDNYAERYNKFYSIYSQDSIVISMGIDRLDKSSNKTTNATMELAYYDNKYSYVKNSDTVVISNETTSYLVDYTNKTAQKAAQGTWRYTKRSEFNIMFNISDVIYIETIKEKCEDGIFINDKYSWGNYTVNCLYDDSDNLISCDLENDNLIVTYKFNSVSLCENTDYFILTSDYTVTDYVKQ